MVLGLRRQGCDQCVPEAGTHRNQRRHLQLNTSADGSTKVGYIRLKQFTMHRRRCGNQAHESDGAQGYVLDLRSNPGGLLEASIDIARQWLDEGTIVSTRTREGIRDVS